MEIMDSQVVEEANLKETDDIASIAESCLRTEGGEANHERDVNCSYFYDEQFLPLSWLASRSMVFKYDYAIDAIPSVPSAAASCTT